MNQRGHIDSLLYIYIYIYIYEICNRYVRSLSDIDECSEAQTKYRANAMQMPLLIMFRSPTTALVTLISSVMILFVKVSLFSSCFSRRMLGKLGLKRSFLKWQ